MEQYDEKEFEFEELQESSSFREKLPALNILLESKNLFYDVDEKSKEAIIQLVKYGKNLENIIRLKNKEIQRLEYLNKYLIIAQ